MEGLQGAAGHSCVIFVKRFFLNREEGCGYLPSSHAATASELFILTKEMHGCAPGSSSESSESRKGAMWSQVRVSHTLTSPDVYLEKKDLVGSEWRLKSRATVEKMGRALKQARRKVNRHSHSYNTVEMRNSNRKKCQLSNRKAKDTCHVLIAER